MDHRSQQRPQSQVHFRREKRIVQQGIDLGVDQFFQIIGRSKQAGRSCRTLKALVQEDIRRFVAQRQRTPPHVRDQQLVVGHYKTVRPPQRFRQPEPTRPCLGAHDSAQRREIGAASARSHQD